MPSTLGSRAVRVLTRQELTAALAARQGLIERWNVGPAEAIRRLTPLQAQHPPAPYVALAARLGDFTREDLQHAIDHRQVVKTTIMRLTLHLAAAADFPAYAQLARQPRLRAWRKTYAALDEQEVAHELTAWFETPRTNAEIRERVSRYAGVTDDAWTPIIFARTLLPLVQLPPAGHFRDARRPRFAVDPRPRPDLATAAQVVLTRYLEAFGPASRKDVAAWAGVAQRDFDFAGVRTVSYRDEHGTELLDLPDRPLPPPDTPLPPRFLAGWDQVLLAYADRERVLPSELKVKNLTVTGEQTLTVDGRVAASWRMVENALHVTPHRDFDHAATRAEALRTARFLAPRHARHDVRFE